MKIVCMAARHFQFMIHIQMIDVKSLLFDSFTHTHTHMRILSLSFSLSRLLALHSMHWKFN